MEIFLARCFGRGIRLLLAVLVGQMNLPALFLSSKNLPRKDLKGIGEMLVIHAWHVQRQTRLPLFVINTRSLQFKRDTGFCSEYSQ